MNPFLRLRMAVLVEAPRVVLPRRILAAWTVTAVSLATWRAMTRMGTAAFPQLLRLPRSFPQFWGRRL